MLISLYNGDFEYWQLYHKVTFDGVNKIIQVNFGETALDVERDIYSAWKEWVRVRDNGKYEQAMRSVGGDPLPGDDRLGATFFLTNGWRIRTWEGNHTLTVFGNLYTDEGEDPFIQTLGQWTILVNQRVSNLVDKISVGGLDPDVIPTAEQIAAAVWDRLVEDHKNNGTFGQKLGRTQVYVVDGDGYIFEIDKDTE
jgi:hypothetical protein